MLQHTDENCPYRVHVSGRCIGHDHGYPSSAWGGYLPGDEPGEECELSGERIDGWAGCEITHCPRMEATALLCPHCAEDGEVTQLLYDTYDDDWTCPVCNVVLRANQIHVVEGPTSHDIPGSRNGESRQRCNVGGSLERP